MKKWMIGSLAVALLNTVCLGAMPVQLVVGAGFANPIGFHDATPTFSWKLPVGVERQTAYRIEVQGDDVRWGGGWVESDQSVYVPYGGSALASRQQLNWRVQFRDQDGRGSDWSQPASFELGLLTREDWQAEWISPTCLSESESELKLMKAVYRSKENPDKNMDVTALLQGKIKENTLSIRVDNPSLGGDPIYGERKELFLSYRLDGENKTQVFDEDQNVSIPSGKQLGKQPATEPVAYLRREFSADSGIQNARLYVTARGLYQISLNGKKVGDDVFTPGWTSYANRIDTQTYDVTTLIQQGPNTLGAMLGTGWYLGRLSWRSVFFGEKSELLLQLEITYANGQKQTILSDGDWKATLNGPIRSSSIYDGEVYDARMEFPGWDSTDFDDAEWTGVNTNGDLGSAALIPKPFQAVRVTETLSVQEITEPEPGRFVFDLGQNMVGRPVLTIPVQKGQTITVRFAEMLKQDGTMYTANYRSAKSIGFYSAAQTGMVTWKPTFTFYGFRYVELSGFPDGVEPASDWVLGEVLHTDMPRIGTFESSHDKLNQLQRNIVWGQRGNFLDIPTDCPQRDERMGWTGDAQVFCPTALFNFDGHAFFKSWLDSMTTDQFPDGRIPDVIPNILKGGGSPGWMDAATIVPWDVYVRTGDIEILSANYEMMERLVGYYRSQAQHGLIRKIKAWGDWLQPYARQQKGDTPFPLLGSAFYARSVQILADSARELGKTEDAKRYGDEARFVKNAFAKYYFDANGKLQNAPETQTGYILAYAFDLVPEELKKQGAKNLVRLVGAADGHLRTGFLGTPYIAQVLDQIGQAETAFTVLFKETYPSWFFSINQGATTLWERWNSYSHKDGFGDANMNSFNHYAYGAIGQWMYERVAGIAPDPTHPGYKHFFVRPLPGGPLTWARAELETRYGKISSGWNLQGDTLQMHVTVPPNTTATVEFPNGRASETVSAGTHSFLLNMNKGCLQK
jgi:alpha-L-rhamnosidase